MRGMRSTAAVLVGLLLATGLVRGATGQFGAIRDRARKTLEASATKNDVKLDDALSLPPVLADVQELTPGSQAAFSLTGRFSPATTFSVAGIGLTMSSPSVAQNTVEGTITAAPGALPGAALVRGKTKGGKTAETVVAYVTGSWRIEGTTDNGWRVRLSSASSGRKGVLAFKGEFFEGAATAPFTARDATLALQPHPDTTAKYILQFKPLDLGAAMGDAECDPIMKRANELAGQLMNAKTQAEEDRVSAEVDKIQDKIDTCVERQQENAGKISEKMTQASKQAELDAKKFGCTSLELAVASDGAAEGTFTCSSGSPSFTGTMKPVAR